MCQVLKESKTKKKMPKCPNCKEKYKIFVLDPCGEDDFHEKYLIEHTNKTCPFGLQSYQNSTQQCVDSVKEHIKEKFPYLR